MQDRFCHLLHCVGHKGRRKLGILGTPGVPCDCAGILVGAQGLSGDGQSDSS